MTQAVAGQLIDQDWFRCLSPEAQERVLQQVELLSFELGQQLVEGGIIPGRVLILLEGRARLVGQVQGRLLSLGKVDTGAVLGAASLLNGRGIENLIASDALTAAAIPDELWAELHGGNDSFRRWCQGQLWPAETIALVQDLQTRSARSDATSLALLQEALAAARRVPLDPAAIQQAEVDGREVFLSSAWGGSTPRERDDTAAGK